MDGCDVTGLQVGRVYDLSAAIAEYLVVARGIRQPALDWMNSHGYPTGGAYYPAVQVIGFQFEYMALIAGRWDIVLKVGA